MTGCPDWPDDAATWAAAADVADRNTDAVVVDVPATVLVVLELVVVLRLGLVVELVVVLEAVVELVVVLGTTVVVEVPGACVVVVVLSASRPKLKYPEEDITSTEPALSD